MIQGIALYAHTEGITGNKAHADRRKTTVCEVPYNCWCCSQGGIVPDPSICGCNIRHLASPYYLLHYFYYTLVPQT